MLIVIVSTGHVLQSGRLSVASTLGVARWVWRPFWPPFINAKVLAQVSHNAPNWRVLGKLPSDPEGSEMIRARRENSGRHAGIACPWQNEGHFLAY